MSTRTPNAYTPLAADVSSCTKAHDTTAARDVAFETKLTCYESPYFSDSCVFVPGTSLTTPFKRYVEDAHEPPAPVTQYVPLAAVKSYTLLSRQRREVLRSSSFLPESEAAEEVYYNNLPPTPASTQAFTIVESQLGNSPRCQSPGGTAVSDTIEHAADDINKISSMAPAEHDSKEICSTVLSERIDLTTSSPMSNKADEAMDENAATVGSNSACTRQNDCHQAMTVPQSETAEPQIAIAEPQSAVAEPQSAVAARVESAGACQWITKQDSVTGQA